MKRDLMKQRCWLAALLAVAVAGPARLSVAQYSLTVLHNNDAESKLLNAGSGLEQFGGVARFKSLVDDTRAFYEGIGHGVVTISSGDNFIPGPELAASLDSGTFYGAQAVSQIGYDAIVLGNHEFDLGPSVLESYIAGAQSTNATPFISANLDFSAEPGLQAQVNSGLIAPSTIASVNTAAGVKQVGIIGATTENLPFISTAGNVAVNSVAAAVNAEIANLQAANVDHIILASHLQGISEDQALVPMLNAGVDLIIAGGGDDLLASPGAASPSAVNAGAPASVVDTGFVPGDAAEAAYPNLSPGVDLGGNTVPIVATDADYKYLGRVTLNFDAAGNLTGVGPSSNPQRVASTTADPVAGVVADSTVTATIQPVADFVAGLQSEIIGQTSQAMPHSSNLIRSDERAIGNLVADAVFQAATEAAGEGRFASVPEPDFALVNGGGIRAGLAAGDVSEGDTFSISRFQNVVTVVEDVTAEDLKLLLENAYSRTVGTPNDPMRQGDGTGRFAQLSGLSVTYDITAQPLVLDRDGVVVTPGARIVSVLLDDGTAIVEDGRVVSSETFDIATLDFLARGGDQYFDTDYQSQAYSFSILGITDQQSVSAYIQSFAGGDLASDFRYDNLPDGRVVTIPEPATLLLVALLGVGGAGKRGRG